MSTWNHRVFAHKSKGLDSEDEIYFQVHEVYYDDDGGPRHYTKNAISIGGDKYSEIQWQLSMIQECLTKPIIDAENFPEEYNGEFLNN